MRMNIEDPADDAKRLNSMIPAPRFSSPLPILPSVSIRAIHGQNSLRFPSVVVHRGPGESEAGEVLAEAVGIIVSAVSAGGSDKDCPRTNH